MISEALIPFVLLWVAVIGLWVHRNLWTAALILSIGAGYVTGALRAPAVAWLAILTLLALGYRWQRDRSAKPRQIFFGITFFLFALACSLLFLPGFERTPLIPETILSPGARPFSVGLGFPKVVTGILILGLINETRIRGLAEAGAVLRRAAPLFALTTLAALACVYATGYVAFAPKWTALFVPWAIANLFFTCLSEEAFFRGFLQHELARINVPLAIGLSAVSFGLVHFGGGVSYVLAATVAGAGYAYTFHRTQRIEAAIAVHFGVNALHFLFFTYPSLAA